MSYLEPTDGIIESNVEETVFFLQSEHCGQRLGQVDIKADRGPAVLGQELGRGIGSIGADGQRAVSGHGIGQQRGDLIVFLDAAGVEALRAGRAG